jgi:lysophospholipase L1-like esterase
MKHSHICGYLTFLAYISCTVSALIFYSCEKNPTGNVPPLSITVAGDSVVTIHDTLTLRVSVPEASARGVRYVWFIDLPGNADTTADSILLRVCAVADTGGHYAVVKAVDRDGVESRGDTMHYSVVYRKPGIALFADSVAVVGIPYAVRFVATPGVRPIERLYWYRDDPSMGGATVDTLLSIAWKAADTGVHTIVAWAQDQDGITSDRSSINICVTARRPAVRPVADSIGYAGVPFPVNFASLRGAGPIDRFEWFIDDPVNIVSTPDTALLLTWAVADTGMHLFVVRAIDRDSLSSDFDTLAIRATYTRPRMAALRDTSVKVNNTLVLALSAADSLLPIARYVYSFDDSAGSSTSSDGIITASWGLADTGRHFLVVKAVNGISMESIPDTSIVTVTWQRPEVRISADVVGAAGDSIPFVALGSDRDGRVVEYRWLIDDTLSAITTNDTLSWRFNDTVETFHTVHVVAEDDDGLFSDAASTTIKISLMRPRLSLKVHDTTLYAHQNLLLTADAFDTNGVIIGYRWSLDGTLLPLQVPESSATFRFTIQESGTHVVTCAAIDDDSLVSSPDTVMVRVLQGMPSMTAMSDTTVSSLDTVDLTCTANDPNGTIVRYRWTAAGAGLYDSTLVPRYRFGYNGQARVAVMVAAVDDDGLIAADTVVVVFNRPPDTITLSKPRYPADTGWLSLSAPACTVTFHYSTQDLDNDSITYSLQWGRSPDTLNLVYEGNLQSFSMTVAKEGVYYWQLVARDSFGNTRALKGTFVAMNLYRICFIGHSIVAGMGGDSIVGGFRGGVLDSLRKLLSPTARLKSVGTRNTAHMKRSAADDSCLAVSGIKAIDIYQMLISEAATLNADIWVFMTGANDAFSTTERNYANQIINIMISRNRAARVYVLNSPPLDSTFSTHNANLPGFNTFLSDSVAAKASRGSPIFLVDAFTALTVNGKYNKPWFYDYVHPNQTGYNRLTAVITTRLKESVPPAIPPGQ